MSYIMVDVEADGPCPGDYSMICFGAVLVEKPLDKTFYGQMKPMTDKWIPEALAVSGFTRYQIQGFENPEITMENFRIWIEEISRNSRPMFIADNNGFDWQFINYYFWHFLQRNPFGYSSTNLGSLYKGYKNNMYINFKKLRNTKHTHNPVDDAMGNAEAMLKILDMMKKKRNGN